MGESRSLCSHLAGSTAQPLVCFSGSEYQCAACASERICELLADGVTAGEVCAMLDFTRCGHYAGDGWRVCHLCSKGLTGFLTVLWSLAAFQDRMLKRGLSRLLEHIRKHNGGARVV